MVVAGAPSASRLGPPQQRAVGDLDDVLLDAAAIELDGAGEPRPLARVAAPLEAASDPATAEAELHDGAACHGTACQVVPGPPGEVSA